MPPPLNSFPRPLANQVNQETEIFFLQTLYPPLLTPIENVQASSDIPLPTGSCIASPGKKTELTERDTIDGVELFPFPYLVLRRHEFVDRSLDNEVVSLEMHFGIEIKIKYSQAAKRRRQTTTNHIRVIVRHTLQPYLNTVRIFTSLSEADGAYKFLYIAMQRKRYILSPKVFAIEKVCDDENVDGASGEDGLVTDSLVTDGLVTDGLVTDDSEPVASSSKVVPRSAAPSRAPPPRAPPSQATLRVKK